MVPRVAVILEGFDNTGKTILAKRVAEVANVPYHSPIGHSDDYYNQCMKHLVLNGGPTVFDRFYLSELIYTKMLKRPPVLTHHQTDVLESMLLKLQPMLIVCYRNENDIRSSWPERKQHFPEIVDRIAEFQLEYRIAAKYFKPYLNVIEVNDFQPETTLMAAVEWLKMTGETQIPNYGRGNWVNPVFFIVGEKFANNNIWKVPFERSESAQMITTALREVGVNPLDCWWTNAIKKGTSLDNINRSLFQHEVEFYKPRVALSFGKTARFICEIVGIPAVHFHHPAYYLRRNTPDQFYKDFRERWRRYEFKL